MFEYNICNIADTALFCEQCKALEKAIPGLQKLELLTDVDETLVQEYLHQDGRIWVKNDQMIDALYVQSEFDVKSYFTEAEHGDS